MYFKDQITDPRAVNGAGNDARSYLTRELYASRINITQVSFILKDRSFPTCWQI